ncbi:MAG: 5-(carboxyamino)imidazole ribonucleotide synthase [Gemmatimonadota bacterium]|nr:5-(carboxyamino)imidazole ribonucleotide synthase [Gemmatimonadota bacterium]
MSGTSDLAGKSAPVLPGSTIGILGSGQLGRMIAIAARRMGYRVHTLSPESDSPTGHVADREVVAAYDDVEAVKRFAADVDVITLEFENISAECVDAASSIAPVRPKGSVLHTTQNRLREKTFLAEHEFPVAPFRHVKSREELAAAVAEIGTPAVLKTAGFGYDGKGQVKIESADDVVGAWTSMAGQEAVLEAFIDFELELSVVAARGLAGDFAHYGAVQNKHSNHILDVTTAPAVVSGAVNVTAVNLTRKVFEALGVVGVACVEYFLDRDGNLIINEIAPRVHNSGHFTFDACVTSQFEQQVRAVCGLPLGSTEQPRPAAMANLLGDLWANGEPDWAAALAIPDVKLHLYGKQEARPGRKMGHLTAMADTREQAVEKVVEARTGLEVRSQQVS